jgi:Domain of unknown function (DUF4145)
MSTHAPATPKRFCPRCGNVSPQLMRYAHKCEEDEWTSEGEAFGLPSVYFVVSCQTCDGFLVYADYGDIGAADDFTKAVLVYPGNGVDASVPERVAAIYSEAARIKRIAPNAFATQIRRALEAVCDDRGGTSGTLATQLKELASRGEIPPPLASLTDTLRTLGNIGAHATDEKIEPWQVESIDELFRAVIEYIYVAPSRLKSFKESLTAKPSPIVDEV